MKRAFTALTFLLAGYAAIMSTPGVVAQGRQLLFPRGTAEAPGLAVDGERRTGLYVDENSNLAVSYLGSPVATFNRSGLASGAPAGVATDTANTWTATQSFDNTGGTEILFPGSSASIVSNGGELNIDTSAGGDLNIKLDTGANAELRVEDTGALSIFRCQGDLTSEAGCHFERTLGNGIPAVEVDEQSATIYTAGSTYTSVRIVPTIAAHTGGTYRAIRLKTVRRMLI